MRWHLPLPSCKLFLVRVMIEILLNDRLGKKVRVKCNEDDTIGDLKKLAAAQLGTRPEKLRIQKWYVVCGARSESSGLCGAFVKSKALCALCSLLTHCFCARYTIYKDHITLEDYEIHDGMSMELYYN